MRYRDLHDIEAGESQIQELDRESRLIFLAQTALICGQALLVSWLFLG